MWFKKEEKKTYPIPDNNTVKVDREELEKIQEALNKLNNGLLESNAEKLRFAGFRI